MAKMAKCDKTALFFRIPDNLRTAWKAYAAAHDRPMAYILREALGEYLAVRGFFDPATGEAIEQTARQEGRENLPPWSTKK